MQTEPLVKMEREPSAPPAPPSPPLTLNGSIEAPELDFLAALEVTDFLDVEMQTEPLVKMEREPSAPPAPPSPP
ncbi:hypothetical protein ACLKA6_012637 [Drosophila palustris]